MKKIKFTITALLVTANIWAQSGKGSIVLFNEQSLNGNLEVHWEKNLVSIDIGSQIKVFSTSEIKKLEFFDTGLGVERYFSAIESGKIFNNSFK